MCLSNNKYISRKMTSYWFKFPQLDKRGKDTLNREKQLMQANQEK